MSTTNNLDFNLEDKTLTEIFEAIASQTNLSLQLQCMVMFKHICERLDTLAGKPTAKVDSTSGTWSPVTDDLDGLSDEQLEQWLMLGTDEERKAFLEKVATK